MRVTGFILSAWIVALAIGVSHPRTAEANIASCSKGSCTSASCTFNCDTSHDYIIFGQVLLGPKSYGFGICFYDSDGAYSKGTCRGCITENYVNPALYIVNADSGSIGALGVDVIRLGNPTGADTCVLPSRTYTIRGYYLPGGAEFEFYGDGGPDRLYLCDQFNPSAGDCISNLGTASGGWGDDTLYGSVTGDTLFGGLNQDYLLGYEGGDWLYGDDNTDHLWGGGGDDFLFGGSGADYLMGDAACDTLNGGTGTELDCWCGSAPGPAEGEAYNCDGIEQNCNPAGTCLTY